MRNVQLTAIFFPMVIFYTFFDFSSSMVVWKLGFWGWGFGFGFWGLGFQLMGLCLWCGQGVRTPWCGTLLVFWGWGSLYKHRRITLGKNFALLTACHRRCIVEEDHDFHRKKFGAYLAMFSFTFIMIQLNHSEALAYNLAFLLMGNKCTKAYSVYCWHSLSGSVTIIRMLGVLLLYNHKNSIICQQKNHQPQISYVVCLQP